MKTILILDDEQVVRHSFVDYFEDNLWRVFQAESAEDALVLLETMPSNAAIVDMRLPGMDGNAFIRQAHHRYPEMVFVICTGSPEYRVPDDLLLLSRVSSRLYRKPVKDIGEIEREVIKLMALAGLQGNSNE